MIDGLAAGQSVLAFGGLLRQLRDDAGLTQDELAEAARVSQRAVSDLERGSTPPRARACDHHIQALAIARDLGTAPEEARALEGIGHSYLRDANPAQATAPLRDALAIYQRIGSPVAARRVRETLRQHELATSAHATQRLPADPAT